MKRTGNVTTPCVRYADALKGINHDGYWDGPAKCSAASWGLRPRFSCSALVRDDALDPVMKSCLKKNRFPYWLLFVFPSHFTPHHATPDGHYQLQRQSGTKIPCTNRIGSAHDLKCQSPYSTNRHNEKTAHQRVRTAHHTVLSVDTTSVCRNSHGPWPTCASLENVFEIDRKLLKNCCVDMRQVQKKKNLNLPDVASLHRHCYLCIFERWPCVVTPVLRRPLCTFLTRTF